MVNTLTSILDESRVTYLWTAMIFSGGRALKMREWKMQER